MTEAQTLKLYRSARDAYDAAPSYVTASEVGRLAGELVAISDDYAAHRDEADDILAEESGA